MINYEDTTIQIPVAGVHPEVYSPNVLYGHRAAVPSTAHPPSSRNSPNTGTAPNSPEALGVLGEDTAQYHDHRTAPARMLCPNGNSANAHNLRTCLNYCSPTDYMKDTPSFQYGRSCDECEPKPSKVQPHKTCQMGSKQLD